MRLHPRHRVSGATLCIGFLFCVLASGCGGGESSPTAAAFSAEDGAEPGMYSGTSNWLCHPDKQPADDACASDLATFSLAADGSVEQLHTAVSADPEVDCFYVYPTASADPSTNSDLNPGPQEIQTTAAQFARYGASCRLFAPVYRQITLTRLALGVAGGVLPVEIDALGIPDEARELAYSDVKAAWEEYLSEHAGQRGFILVGHSQGAGLLRRLIAEEIETRPALHQRLISAHLIGTTVAVPLDADMGGSFSRTPACRSSSDLGCVVSYASFRAGDPQLDQARFGAAPDAQSRALCTNPAALMGGEAALSMRMPFRLPPVYQTIAIPRGSGGPYRNLAQNLVISEPYYAVPEQIRAECVLNEAGTNYLEIRIQDEPNSVRADDYPGEFFGGIGWGMHLVDMYLAMQDLVDLAEAQTQAWLAK